MQNALKHLGHLFKAGSTFGKDFKECIYECEDENELCEAWEKLLDKYNLWANDWMDDKWIMR